MFRTAIVLATVVLTACSTGAASSGDPKQITVDQTWAKIRGQYGKVWPNLHPRYQRVVGRARWENCQRKAGDELNGIEWLSIKATDDYPDRLPFALLGTLSVTAVSMEAKIDYLGIKRTVRDTVYWVKVNGTWRGLWDQKTYRAYKAGRCP